MGATGGNLGDSSGGAHKLTATECSEPGEVYKGCTYTLSCSGGKAADVLCWNTGSNETPPEATPKAVCTSKEACTSAVAAAKAEGLSPQDFACNLDPPKLTFWAKPHAACKAKSGDELCKVIDWQAASTKTCLGEALT